MNVCFALKSIVFTECDLAISRDQIHNLFTDAGIMLNKTCIHGEQLVFMVEIDPGQYQQMVNRAFTKLEVADLPFGE